MAKAQAPGAKGPHLESQQEEEGFDTVETAVHKVSHEEVVGLGDIAAYLGGGRQLCSAPSYPLPPQQPASSWTPLSPGAHAA